MVNIFREVFDRLNTEINANFSVEQKKWKFIKLICMIKSRMKKNAITFENASHRMVAVTFSFN